MANITSRQPMPHAKTVRIFTAIFDDSLEAELLICSTRNGPPIRERLWCAALAFGLEPKPRPHIHPIVAYEAYRRSS